MPPRVSHILCPVDDSPGSRRAFSQAVALARLYRARITALHVTERAMNGEGMHVPASLLVSPHAEAQVAHDVTSFVAAWGPTTVPVDIATDAGPVADAIINQARALQADVIVMGMRGRLNLGYVALGALGSVTLEVVRDAPCPVLVVPPGMHRNSESTFRHIICPVDFGPASLRAVEHALAFAQEASATLVLLYVLDPGATRNVREAYDTRPRPLDEAAARRALSALVPAGAHDYCRPLELVATGTPDDEILRAAEALQADAIVMGLGERSAAEMLLLGSTADPVLRRARCPVLTVHAPTR